jgi:molybdate transport system substrate-binding protein
MSRNPRYFIIVGAAVVAAAVIVLANRSDHGARTAAEGAGAAGDAGRPGAGQTQITVYVPCGLIVPMTAVVTAYNEAHPDVEITPTYDNAVILMRLIRDKGHRPDLFVSPGERELAELEAKGLIEPSSQRQFGQFTLAVIIPKKNPAGIHSLDDLQKAKVIACPDPTENSVGYYARQSLQHLALWDGLESKFQYTEHAIQAHTFVAAAKVDAGFAYESCPLDTAPEKLSKSKVAILCELPKETYDTPKCVIAMLRESKHRQQAMAFADYLVTPETLAVLEANGLPSPGTGSVSAPEVYVQAFYPDDEAHNDIKQLVMECQESHPGKVRAEFIDSATKEGLKRRTDAGLKGPGITINGQNTATIGEGKSARQVTFQMDAGAGWTAEDLKQAVAGAVQQADAEPAPASAPEIKSEELTPSR